MRRTWPIVLGQLREVADWCYAYPNYILHAPALLASRLRWARRFSRAVRGFDAASNDGITVHFKPDSWDDLDIDLFLMCCRHSRNDLAKRFGFPLSHVHIFVFENRETVAAFCDRPFAGFALPRASSMVISRNEFIEEMVRHELVHIFASRWSSNVPGILREGLAVWSERTRWGHSVDSHARYWAVSSRPLASCLDEKNFHDPAHCHSCYNLSGSFTGYLLRHFGWDRYRRLYIRATPKLFTYDFELVFGLSFEKAEHEWLKELRRFTPIRNRA